MSQLKVAVIGAGSFVFGPSMLDQAILQHRLEDLEIALVDPDREIVELMGGVGRRMASERGVRAEVTTHTKRSNALDGASFVICSACREIYRRFEMDCDIIDRYAPGHLISEFGGIQGISYSLRQIALIGEIAEDMKRLCPGAWLLNASNPLPRVTQAAHEMGIKTAGFCSVSTVGYENIWRIFGGKPLPFPYTPAQERWELTMAGLNHLCWVVEMRERASGQDLLPELRERIRSGATAGNPHCERFALETGYLLVPNDHHTRDFLVPKGDTHGREQPTHGSPAERQRRLKLLRDIADGKEPWDPLMEHGAWERPIDLIAAMAYDKPTRFNSLNLVNRGQIPNLPGGLFVETPCTASSDGPAPQTVELPEAVLPYCQRTALVTDTIVRAAMQRRRKLVHEVIELDPTILDKRAGIAAIDACMAAHADILPPYA